MKKTQTRQCISCRVQLPRNSFIRILKKQHLSDNSYEVVLNPNKYEFGRSLYICRNLDCTRIALKQKKIEKILKVSQASLKNITEILNNKIIPSGVVA